MPEIEIQDSTFARLQQHAKPLVDTTDTVINRALDALEKIGKQPGGGNGQGTGAEREIDPRALPNLTHTKLLDASIEGKPVVKPNWNLLLDEMLRCAMKHLGSFESVHKHCPVNMVKGRKEDEGYGHLSDIDISVQGLDANGACQAVVTAAKGLGVELDIGFMWRLKEAAAHPGEKARLKMPGTRVAEVTKAA